MANIDQLTRLIKMSEGEERENTIKMLDKPVHAALSLLDDLLEWSRSTRQQSISNKDNIKVSDIVNRSIELFHEQAEAKQIQLNANIPDEVIVFADVNHVSSILRNLISNAIKFTPAGGKVTIDHKSENGRVTVRVKDSGLGIQPQHIKIILEGKFFTTYGTQNEKGSGFGLMLCQEFVRLNNGRLNIESVVGKGSTISFTLPAANH
jgi:signal transduction histidine kinase